MSTPKLDLEAIRERYRATAHCVPKLEIALQSSDDVPMLIREVERLRKALQEIALGYGWQGSHAKKALGD